MHLEKVQKGDFLKKDSWELNFFSCFRLLLISQRPGTLNWERVVFLPSKNLYRKCDWSYRLEHQSCNLWIQFFVLLANFVGWLVAHWINVSFKGSIHSMSITQIVVYSFTLWSTLNMRNNFKLLIQKLWTIVLWRRSYQITRRVVGSTYQTCSNDFYFRIAWKSIERTCFLQKPHKLTSKY